MDKRYYWFKLKEPFFMGDIIDYILSQENGSDFIIIYLMLCMIAINKDGKLSLCIGEEEVPFTNDKLKRDLKHFSEERIERAIELFKKFRMISEDENGILTISNFADIVGSESDSAVKKRKQREKIKKGEDKNGDNIKDNVPTDKDVDKDRDVNKNVDKEKKREGEKTEGEAFEPPTLDMVIAYAGQKGYPKIKAEKFYYHYRAKGWQTGKSPIEDWKASINKWLLEDREKELKGSSAQNTNKFNNCNNRSGDLDEVLGKGRTFKGKKV